MRRSEINVLLAKAKAFFAEHRFHLPPWAFWGPDGWKGHGESEVVRNMLGWDLTDYGGGDFHRKGLLLFTIRNGSPDGRGKPYAEKIMIVEQGQVCPMHFHWAKMEDIINRGGGNLEIELYGSDDKGDFSAKPLVVSVDGMKRRVEPGGTVVLTPGESITLERGMYHTFTGQACGGRVLVGEVSSVNDDNEDNRFYEAQPRFPDIEEDEPPMHLLVTDYPNFV